MDKIPRRAYIDLLVPAEKAIHDAIALIEKLEPDERLTDAIVFLSKAHDKVSDYVDNKAEI